MIRRIFTSGFLLLSMLGVAVAHADDGFLTRFSCGLTGHWDNAQQARQDAAAGLDDVDRHPRRAMTYVPIANNNIDGQLFAIINYDSTGFNGEISRVSTHRFRLSEETGEILHEFLFLREPDRWDGFATNPAELQQISEADVRFNSNCAMRWYWREDHFAGGTKKGQCVTSSFTVEPIQIEGHGELRDRQLLRHDQNFTLDNELLPIAGGNSPELFDKVEREVDPDSVAARILATSADLRCSETREDEP